MRSTITAKARRLLPLPAKSSTFGRFWSVVRISGAIGSLLLAQTSAPAQQDLTFTGADGATLSAASMRGKVTILLFSSVQDPQCRSEFKALTSLADRYRGRDVNIYWVSINPLSNEQLKSPCGPAGSITVLRDPTQAAFKRYSGTLSELPTVVVLDKQGQVYGRPRGGFNPNSDFVNDLGVITDGLLKK